MHPRGEAVTSVRLAPRCTCQRSCLLQCSWHGTRSGWTLRARPPYPTLHHIVVPCDPTADQSWKISDGLAFQTDGVHAGDAVGARVAAGGGLSAEEASEGAKRLKQRLLLGLIDSLNMEQALIFCRTNVDCDKLEALLTAAGGSARFRGAMERGKENSYSCVVLAGMRSMDERRKNLEAFKAGDVRFLVCTDVAARGLDVRELPFVINMCLPENAESYIHRVGRRLVGW